MDAEYQDTVNDNLKSLNGPVVGQSIAATDIQGVKAGVSKNQNDYVAQSHEVNNNLNALQ